MFAPGTMISSKYRVERTLGEGGMGIVFEATHVELDGRVALKFLRAEALARPDIVARFAQEARAAVRLKSEHVARVNDVGTHEGMPYLVMEMLEGKNLEEVLAASGPLPVSRVAELVIDACEGISEAHARGIIHRDIKPANLFLVEHDGMDSIKVLDFGISKAALTGKVTDVDIKSSATTSMMGSPHYMSPEQVRSTRDVDLRTDVWSLGVVVYELLAGRTPFDAKTEFTELVAAILEEAPAPLLTARPDVPAELAAVVERCLTKDRALRYQTAAELALALLPFAHAKRAGVVAARAVAVVKRAGLAPDLVVPATLPPPPGSDPANSFPVSSTNLRLSPPSIDELGKTAVSAAQPAVAFTVAKPSPTPMTTGNTLPEAARPEPRSKRRVAVALGVLLALGAAAAFFVVRGSRSATAVVEPERASAAAAATAPTLPTSPASAALAAPPEAKDAAGTGAQLTPTSAAAASAHPTPKAVKKPAHGLPAPTAAPRQDLEIRRER